MAKTPSISKKAHAVVLAPMSETAAQLLHQLVQDAADAAAPAPGSIILPGRPEQSVVRFNDNHGELHTSGAGYELSIYRGHGRANPLWWGSETRSDSAGGRWTGPFKYWAQDDYGTLVEVRP